MKTNKIALFDLDGTLADYDGQLLKNLHRIASEHEPPPVLNEGRLLYFFRIISRSPESPKEVNLTPRAQYQNATGN